MLRPILIVALLASAAAVTMSAKPVGSANEPRLILVQQFGETSRTFYIADHITFIETLPFDGMTVHIPASWSVMSGRPLDYREVYDHWLAPIDGIFQRFDHNFLMAFNDDPGDVFDDRAWAVTVQNWRILARAARAAGFVGICFDNEEYQRTWDNFPENYPGTTRSLREYQDQTRLRGRQIMRAIVAEFPDVELLTFHGPYLSEPATPPSIYRNQSGDASYRELLGPFFAGFIEAKGPLATVIDGGEVYQYRSTEDFRASYAWRKRGIASAATDSAFITPELRPRWSRSVDIGFGVYNQPWPQPRIDTMDPTIMRHVLERALRRTDRYVWYYTEQDNWLIPGDMPREWGQAVRTARAAVGLPNP